MTESVQTNHPAEAHEKHEPHLFLEVDLLPFSPPLSSVGRVYPAGHADGQVEDLRHLQAAASRPGPHRRRGSGRRRVSELGLIAESDCHRVIGRKIK